MIVREVLEDPELINCFDWFNDGENTINWLKWMQHREQNDSTAQLITQMEKKFLDYKVSFFKAFIKNS